MMARAPSEQQDERLFPAALVTGGSRRIGRQIALELARAGYDVAIHCREEDRDAQVTAKDIEALGVRAAILSCDLGDPDSAGALPARAADAFGGLGIVVNNASLFERDEWNTATGDSWAAHMTVNLESPFRIIQAFAKAVPKDLNGVAVNILDQRVFNLTPHFTSYTLSKAGLWTLTQTLALALAPRLRVGAVGPGPTARSPRQTPTDFERQYSIVPLKRRTAPTAIAKAVRFIVENPSFTGQMIALDGGEHLGWKQDADGAYVDE